MVLGAATTMMAIIATTALGALDLDGGVMDHVISSAVQLALSCDIRGALGVVSVAQHIEDSVNKK